MNRFITVVVSMAMAVSAMAQTADRYRQRYEMLVNQFGPAGVGVETVLDNWAKVDSTSADFLFARFSFYFTKAQTTEIVSKPEKKYLGMEPMLTLKDSTGTDVYYYQVNAFDDELYGKAIRAMDKAIALYPERLDFRFMKANAYIAYEKESPDMALPYLLDLAGREKERKWTYDGQVIEQGFYEDALQEYCYSFYSVSSPESMSAFLKLSEKMHGLHPDNPGFLNNIGSYHMLAVQDYKTALKCYAKVLKKHPEDYTAIRNSMLAARKMKNQKLEKKYLQMIVKYGPDNEKQQAQARLDSMKKK